MSQLVTGLSGIRKPCCLAFTLVLQQFTDTTSKQHPDSDNNHSLQKSFAKRMFMSECMAPQCSTPYPCIIYLVFTLMYHDVPFPESPFLQSRSSILSWQSKWQRRAWLWSPRLDVAGDPMSGILPGCWSLWAENGRDHFLSPHKGTSKIWTKRHLPTVSGTSSVCPVVPTERNANQLLSQLLSLFKKSRFQWKFIWH